MIGNSLNILIGLWLAYAAIFATPAGNINHAGLAGAAVAAVVFAIWARQTDRMAWQSTSNIVLGAILLATAAARAAFGIAPLICFWIVLLGGIAIATMAMWSMLYRPEAAAAGEASLPQARARTGTAG